MSLQELAYQLLAPPVQFPFEFALAHLPGFVGGEEGFGIREDSIGRCARGRAREIDARDAGSRLWHVESTSLESCRQSHHRSVPLPMEPYQNAARMSRRERARGGQTDGIRYRFEARLAAGKTRGTCWLGCCPPELSTGETHPRAKRPMNRAKTPLRRRAAPNLLAFGFIRQSYIHEVPAIGVVVNDAEGHVTKPRSDPCSHIRPLCSRGGRLLTDPQDLVYKLGWAGIENRDKKSTPVP